MQATDTQREYQRMIFDKCAEYLGSKGYSCTIEEGYGCYNLAVIVPGPSEIISRFYLHVETEIPGRPIALKAECDLFWSKEQIIRNWSAAQTDRPETLCDDLFIDFVSLCSYKEFAAITEAEIINDTNLDEFFNLLSDEALTLEGVFAVGFRIRDEGGMEIAAAASFFFTEDQLIVDNIAIADYYEIPGFEEYIAQYIFQTVTAE